MIRRRLYCTSRNQAKNDQVLGLERPVVLASSQRHMTKMHRRTRDKQVNNEVHVGTSGSNQTGPKIQVQLKRMGYYWATMIEDCIDFTRRCRGCQYHGIYMLVIGTFTSNKAFLALRGMGDGYHRSFWGKVVREYTYILVAIDYFSKWAEPISVLDSLVRLCWHLPWSTSYSSAFPNNQGSVLHLLYAKSIVR